MILAFDQYQRYKHVEEIINLIRSEESYNILEVGANEHKNLEKFLPNDRITYLDIEVPDTLKNDPQYIEADATNMPQVQNEAFDFVVALDVFEHISKEQRENFIKELHRVSRLGVIIAAPFNSNEVVNAEIRANEYYKQLYGTGFRWLEEHRENELPDLKQTRGYYDDRQIDFVHFQHGSLTIWEKLIQLHFLFADKSKYHSQRFLIDQYYNENVYKHDYSLKSYRSFFVSLKDSKFLNVIRSWISERVEFSKTEIENIRHLEWLENQMKNILLVKAESTLLNANNISNDRLKGFQEKIFLDFSELSESVSLLQNQLVESNQFIKNMIGSSNNVLVEENIELKKQIELQENHIQNIESLNNAITTTKGWRILEKFRRIGLLVKRNKYSVIPKIIRKVKSEGLKSTIQTIELKVQNELQEVTYHEWFLKNKPSEVQLLEMKKEIEQFEKKPLISIAMPTYNTPIHLLKEAICSLQNQIYTNWELCICDDGSTDVLVWEELQLYSKKDKRIKIIRSPENLHIAGATNLAVSLAKGEYVGFLDHDDVLTKDALYEVVKVINEQDPDLIYSDEDKLEIDGIFNEPFFKPDWSPDYLLSVNYICHFSVCRKTLGDDIGWIRTGFDGAQDYDFMLRLTQKCSRIHHIPKILYHWRKVATSTSVNPDAKPYAHKAGMNAVGAFLEQKYGGNAWVDETDYPFVYDPRYKLPVNTKISVIIPTKDNVQLLKECVISIIKESSHQNYEILILNNNSVEEETYKWFKDIQKNNRVKVIDAFFEFNWSKLNNFGIENADGDVFIFLNNDIKIISHDWMERLAEKALREDVGTVGGLLLYEDETIQHAGVVLGMGGWADHVFKGMKPIHFGAPFVSPMVPRNVLASTGACLAISRNTIKSIGDFDEEFIICGSDVEISLRAFKNGYVNLYDPYVKLYHYESKTRDSFIPEIDFSLSKIHYSPYRENGDPYYNVNLALDNPKPIFK